MDLRENHDAYINEYKAVNDSVWINDSDVLVSWEWQRELFKLGKELYTPLVTDKVKRLSNNRLVLGSSGKEGYEDKWDEFGLHKWDGRYEFERIE